MYTQQHVFSRRLKVIAPAARNIDIRRVCELCLLAASSPGGKGYQIKMSAPHAGACEVQTDDAHAFASILSYLFVDAESDYSTDAGAGAGAAEVDDARLRARALKRLKQQRADFRTVFAEAQAVVGRR